MHGAIHLPPKGKESFLAHSFVTLLEVYRFRDLRFLQVSTDEVYGSALGKRGFLEEDRLEPSSPYSASKGAADLFITAYHKTL